LKTWENGLSAWEANAAFWDDYMGDESNYFHRDLVRPSVEKLLDVQEGDVVLDIACGNGNFSKRLAENGARVVAFDYSPKMIELAKKRRESVLNRVDFRVCDATDFEELLKLRQEKLYDKAVSNMAIMDISDIEPLFRALRIMLNENGIFVCATHHPCFTFPNEDYFTNCIDKGEAIVGQPVLQNYYHRTIEDIFHVAFQSGFVLDGFYEVPFEGQTTPIIMILRFRIR
jgi:2-polyprenyl-3-methyl-5-hydroxy-6-metoxy-1,4-benzoquinol methylase